MAVDTVDKQYGAYFTEVQDIEELCVSDAHDDETAAADGCCCLSHVFLLLKRSFALQRFFIVQFYAKFSCLNRCAVVKSVQLN